MDNNDEKMIAHILAGNPSGLNRLVARYGHMLAEYTRALTGDDDERFALIYEDILVDILKYARSVSGRKGELKRYLFESAARTIRKRHPQILRLADETKSQSPPIKDLERVEEPTPELLDHVIAGLNPSERELLLLRYRFGFSYADISDIIREARVRLEDRMLNARHHFRSLLVHAQV